MEDHLGKLRLWSVMLVGGGKMTSISSMSSKPTMEKSPESGFDQSCKVKILDFPAFCGTFFGAVEYACRHDGV